MYDKTKFNERQKMLDEAFTANIFDQNLVIVKSFFIILWVSFRVYNIGRQLGPCHSLVDSGAY